MSATLLPSQGDKGLGTGNIQVIQFKGYRVQKTPRFAERVRLSNNLHLSKVEIEEPPKNIKKETMSKNSRIRDNNNDRTVAAFLKNKIQPGSSLSIVSAYFSIYAFDKLRTSLKGIDDLRFLFGEPSAIGGMDQSKTESKAFELTESGLRLENYLTQSEIAKACADWIKEKKVRDPIRNPFQLSARENVLYRQYREGRCAHRKL